jgi:hypothetical protein
VADATVPQPRHDETLPLREVQDVERRLANSTRVPWLRIVLWTTLTALLVAFLAIGTVRVGAGNWNGRQMRVPVIWDRFIEFLAGQGFSAPAIAALLLVVFVALAGSAYLLWLAFGLRNADAGYSQDSTTR